nr:hypothetical protein [bacterium]
MPRLWTQWQEAYLKAHYADTSAKDIGLVVGRSADAVRLHARGMGLKACWRIPKNDMENIDPEQDKWLKKQYQAMGLDQVFPYEQYARVYRQFDRMRGYSHRKREQEASG